MSRSARRASQSGHERSRAASEAGGGGERSQTGLHSGSRSYLHAMMGTLHGAERVPLWKEEMIERVKRRSAIKKEREAMASSAAATSRQVLRVSGRHGATAAADRSRVGAGPAAAPTRRR